MSRIARVLLRIGGLTLAGAAMLASLACGALTVWLVFQGLGLTSTYIDFIDAEGPLASVFGPLLNRAPIATLGTLTLLLWIAAATLIGTTRR